MGDNLYPNYRAGEKIFNLENISSWQKYTRIVNTQKKEKKKNSKYTQTCCILFLKVHYSRNNIEEGNWRELFRCLTHHGWLWTAKSSSCGSRWLAGEVNIYGNTQPAMVSILPLCTYLHRSFSGFISLAFHFLCPSVLGQVVSKATDKYALASLSL